MRKGVTLIELTITISMLAILISVTVVGYRYYINKSKDQCVSNIAQTIFEATVYSYESSGNIINNTNIIALAKDITGNDVTIVEVNDRTKIVRIQFDYDLRTYVILADLANYKSIVGEVGDSRVIYEQ